MESIAKSYNQNEKTPGMEDKMDEIFDQIAIK